MAELRHARASTPFGPTERMKPVRRRKPVQIDADALAAVKADLDAQQAALEAPKPVEATKRGQTVTGCCHDCGRAVSGERRYCGTCLAKH